MKKNLKDLIGNERIYFDGGMGTQLQLRGLKPGELPETWNLSRKEDLLDIHTAYINAGSNIISANTFGANSIKYKDNLEEIVTEGVKIAKEAVEKSGRDVYVALDIGPTGKLLKPLGDLSFDDCVEIFAKTVRAGAAAGADLILIETMNDTHEAKAAVVAAKENSDLPVMITCVFDQGAKMLTGGSPEVMVSLMEGLGVDALGINCSLGPQQMLPVAKRIMEVSSTPVIITPNAGLPRVEGGNTYYDVTPSEFSDIMTEIAGLGVWGMGGCCGTSPEYIKETVEKTKDLPFSPITPKHTSWVCSSNKVVVFGDTPVKTGEEITETDPYDIVDMVFDLEDEGAEIIGLDLSGEEDLTAEGAEEIFEELFETKNFVVSLCLNNAEILMNTVRGLNGKALIKIKNQDEAYVEEAIRTVKLYGGCLCISEDDAETAARALELGVVKEDIISPKALEI